MKRKKRGNEASSSRNEGDKCRWSLGSLEMEISYYRVKGRGEEDDKRGGRNWGWKWMKAVVVYGFVCQHPMG